ncbi:MAG: RidA family protein [Candidatus Riflebacteria bacterium]|nr:RidA family protein [Candidatus Riflebacteria bacterium]
MTRSTTRIVETRQAPAPVGPYSQAIRAGSLLFLSGQIPIDPVSGQHVAGSIEAETQRVLDNLLAVLAAEGLGFGDVVKTTVYMTDLADFPRMNETYARAFGDARPARATVQVSALPKGVRVEIEAIAAYPDGR